MPRKTFPGDVVTEVETRFNEAAARCRGKRNRGRQEGRRLMALQ